MPYSISDLCGAQLTHTAIGIDVRAIRCAICIDAIPPTYRWPKSRYAFARNHKTRQYVKQIDNQSYHFGPGFRFIPMSSAQRYYRGLRSLMYRRYIP